MNKSRLASFIVPKIKFGTTSAVATSVDYLVFFLVVHFTSKDYATVAQVLAYPCGLITNFFLQKKFIFDLKRSAFTTFKMSVSFSLLGLTMSTLFIYLLSKIEFFTTHLIAAKVLVTGTMFLYNFYTKRFAFEGVINPNQESTDPLENL